MRLHCKEHGYMDEKTGPMAECPYCEIDRLNAENSQLQRQNRDLAAYAKIKAGNIHWQLESRKKVVAKVQQQTAKVCAEIAESDEQNIYTEYSAGRHDAFKLVAYVIKQKFGL